jgi:hypothetical protein
MVYRKAPLRPPRLLLRVAAGAGTIAAVASVAACSSGTGGSSFNDVDASFAAGDTGYPDAQNPCSMEFCGIGGLFDAGPVGLLDARPSDDSGSDGNFDGSEEGTVDDAPAGLESGAGGDAGQEDG